MITTTTIITVIAITDRQYHNHGWEANSLHDIFPPAIVGVEYLSDKISPLIIMAFAQQYLQTCLVGTCHNDHVCHHRN